MKITRPKRKTKFIAALIVVIVIILSLIAYFFFFHQDEENNLTLAEKQWIDNNKNEVYDIAILNNLPIYGYEGSGLFFNFIEDVTEKLGLNFNLVSYDLGQESTINTIIFEEIDSKDVKDNNLVFGEDKFVVFSKSDTSINNISEFSNSSIGALKSDLKEVSYYLSDATNVSYMEFESIDELTEALDANELSYIAIPYTVYLNKTLLKDDYKIVFHLDEMGKKYVLSLNTEIVELKSILEKYFTAWQERNNSDNYEKAVADLYFGVKNINDNDKSNFLGKRYIYGTVANLPYETMVGDKFIGIDEQYLNEYAKIFGVEITFKEYKDVASLKKAFNNGDVDILFNNFNASDIKPKLIKNTIKINNLEYVLATNLKNTDVINSLKSLKDKNIQVVKGTTIYDYLASNSDAKLNAFNNLEDLLQKVNNNDIVALDIDAYEFYKEEYFKDFNIIYNEKLDSNYNFLINNKAENKLLGDTFGYFIESINHKKYNLEGLNKLEGEKITESFIEKHLRGILIVLLVLLVLALIALTIVKRFKRRKIEKKDEKMMFIDNLTALKNRNYLNNAIKQWDENVIYPQAIIVIDLNNIKYINDTYGHEEGDEVIKGAANILITTQLEDSDIIRTDGNEFLIYLVGHREEKIVNYITDLKIRFEEIPHAYGAAIGYSMIEDDIKTIDDAINEANLDMRTDKKAH